MLAMDHNTKFDLLPPSTKRPRPNVQDPSNSTRLIPPSKPPFPSSGSITKDKAEFPVTSLDDFYKNCPTYRLPVEVGAFSLDEEGKTQLDRSQLRYYVLPAHPTRPNFDLNIGFTQFSSTSKNVPSNKLNPILRWISSYGDCFRPQQPLSPTEGPKRQNSLGNGILGKNGEEAEASPVSPKDR